MKLCIRQGWTKAQDIHPCPEKTWMYVYTKRGKRWVNADGMGAQRRRGTGRAGYRGMCGYSR